MYIVETKRNIKNSFCIIFMEKYYGGEKLMQITSCENSNTKYMQVYLTEEELEKQETKEKIENYKNQKYSVAIFVTGKENYPEILRKIVTKQVELTNNVC